MRIPLVAGNWKMYKTLSETKEFMNHFVKLLKGSEKAEVLICPPYTSLYVVNELRQNTKIKLGAQDVHWEEEGAFTGKISCNMLIASGCEYVIIGHSEQRTYFHETDETVNKKIKKSLEKGLTPIVCVGETLPQREANQHHEVVKKQIIEGFKDILDIKNTVIAYEPVWAINPPASPRDATLYSSNSCRTIWKK
jgi:triosephosphate isomerase